MQFLTFLFILLTVFYTNSGFCATSNTSESYIYTEISFNPDDLTFSKFLGYDVIEMIDCHTIPQLGAPSIPQSINYIALPSGALITKIDVTQTASEYLQGEFDLLPVQNPKNNNSPLPSHLEVEPDKTIYENPAPFPAQFVNLLGYGNYAGQNLACFCVYPLHYFPVSKQVNISTKLTLKITYTLQKAQESAGREFSSFSSYLLEKQLSSMVLNPQNLNTPHTEGEISGNLLTDTFDHVIITNSSLAASFADLAKWHFEKGIRDTIVTVAWIYSHYSGSNPQKIRNFIKDAQSTWGVAWVLLGGDTDIIPVEYKYLDGNWTYGDSYYADFDDDWFNEVAIGRASVDNSDHVKTFVSKILTYEKNPPRDGSYPVNAFFFAFDLDTQTKAEIAKEDIDATYMPAQFKPLKKVYDSHSGSHKTNSKNALNEGYNLSNHDDHSDTGFMGTGYTRHYSGLDSNDMKSLTNGNKQTILYSCGCLANNHDANESISEYFVRNTNGGGIGFIGNTNVGLYIPGMYNNLSFYYDKQFFASLFWDNAYFLGQTLMDSKNDNYPGSESYKFIWFETDLLGEPALPIWTDRPETPSIFHANKYAPGDYLFNITLKRSGKPVEGGLACLRKSSELYTTSVTGKSGTSVVPVSFLSSGTVNITVTGQNILPYSSTITVSDAPDVALTLTPNKTEFNRGETLILKAVITNQTSSSQAIDYWAGITIMPDGCPFRKFPFVQPVTTTLAPFASDTLEFTHVIPAGAPLGDYTYSGFIGDALVFVWNEDDAFITVK